MKALRSLALAAFLLAGLACSSPKAKETKYDNPPPPPAAAAGCTADDQCASLGACGRCQGGACVKAEGCCDTDADCPAGGRCRAGHCK